MGRGSRQTVTKSDKGKGDTNRDFHGDTLFEWPLNRGRCIFLKTFLNLRAVFCCFNGEEGNKGPFKKYVTGISPIFEPPTPPSHSLSPFALTPLPPCHCLSLFCFIPSLHRPVTYFLNGPLVQKKKIKFWYFQILKMLLSERRGATFGHA